MNIDAHDRDPNGDHRHLGQVMDLFHIEEHSPGMVFWHPDGWALFRLIEDYMRAVHAKHGYREVRTPQILNKSLWETSGHWGKFRENMFVTGEQDSAFGYMRSEVSTTEPTDRPVDSSRYRHTDIVRQEYAVKPMSCPGAVTVFGHARRSYRDLPYRLLEMGVVHRFEPSGSLSGIMRLRQFTQDDGHLLCTEDQIAAEAKNYVTMLMEVYKTFGFETWTVKLSTRPEVRAGDDATWDKAEQSLMQACQDLGIAYEILPGEGAFYGPKLEFTLTDALGRPWQCGTLQLDYVLPERFDLTYVGPNGSTTREDGTPHRPVMLHHAVLGSLERFIAILLEHHRGVLPLALAPVQIVVCSVSEKSAGYAADVAQKLRDFYGIRAELDDSADKIGAKIRRHLGRKVGGVAVVGEKEIETGEVNFRRLGEKDGEQMDLSTLAESDLTYPWFLEQP